MQKLRSTIEQYAHWSELLTYIDRMEAALISDFSLALENAKALLETIGKEICNARSEPLPAAPSINSVLKKAFCSLGYSNDDLVNKVSGALANIGQEIGSLRNQISPTSHGKSLEELRERNDKVDLLTREFLIDSTLVVAVFLIRAFEGRREDEKPLMTLAQAEVRLDYFEATDFNDSWDETFGEFEMGDYSFTASEILFAVDHNAYQTEYMTFVESAAQSEELDEKQK